MRFFILRPFQLSCLAFFLKLLLSVAPGRFFPPFLKGFACHKKLFFSIAAGHSLMSASFLFLPVASCFFRTWRAWSTCSSAAPFVSPVTSEISQTNILLARSSVWRSRGDRALVSFNSVSDSTTSAKSNADPEVKSLKLSMARCFQFVGFAAGFPRSLKSFGISDLAINCRIPRLPIFSTGMNNSPPLPSSRANW